MTTYRANGRVSSAIGVFVPGPGLIVTNARNVGLEYQPTQVLSIKVVVGYGTPAARTPEGALLKDDPQLDLALLQVTALDLPPPPAHGVTTGLDKLEDAWLVSIFGNGKPAGVHYGAVTGRKDVTGPRAWLRLRAAVLPRARGGRSWTAPAACSASSAPAPAATRPPCRSRRWRSSSAPR